MRPGAVIHLVGACGTAMAALAALLAARGYRVRGSDQDTHPPMDAFLARAGVPVRTPYAAENLDDPPPDLVVVGNAIGRGNPELEAVLDRGLPYRSQAEVLRDEFLEGRHAVVVTGTHGKTTTTALTGLALLAGGLDPSVFAGGWVVDLDGPVRLGGGAPFVLEGDEYDTAFFDKTPKFHKYRPRTLVINNLEHDHADIYPDLEAIRREFRLLVRLVPRSGLVLAGDECEDLLEVTRGALAPVQRFGLRADSYWRAAEVEDGPLGVRFAILREGRPWGSLQLPFSGLHSVRNALAAAAVAAAFGVGAADVARGLAAARGVRRRLEERGRAGGVVVYDDFAHHPTAVRVTLAAVRARHPGARLVAVFEPRSLTCRRRVHQEALTEALAAADVVAIAPVFQPERVPPAERLQPAEVAARLAAAGRLAVAPASVEDVAPAVAAATRPGDVVVVMSNGAFGGVHERLLGLLDAAGRGVLEPGGG